MGGGLIPPLPRIRGFQLEQVDGFLQSADNRTTSKIQRLQHAAKQTAMRRCCRRRGTATTNHPSEPVTASRLADSRRHLVPGKRYHGGCRPGLRGQHPKHLIAPNQPRRAIPDPAGARPLKRRPYTRRTSPFHRRSQPTVSASHYSLRCGV